MATKTSPGLGLEPLTSGVTFQCSKHLLFLCFSLGQITLPDYHRQNSSKPGNEDVTNMFDFIHKVTQRFSIETTRKLIPDLLTFDRWVAENREQLLKLILSE